MHFHMHVNIKKYYIYPVFKNLPFHYSYSYRITSYCICFFHTISFFKKDRRQQYPFFMALPLTVSVSNTIFMLCEIFLLIIF